MPSRLVHHWGAVALLTCVAFGLRLYRLGDQSFWIDEVSSIAVASQSLSDVVRHYEPGRHPGNGAEQAPLAFLVMHLFFSPSQAEASARLPSVLCGTFAVLALFLFVRELWPAPVPLLTAGFLAFSPLHIWYSQEARWYAQWTLLTVLSYWAFVRMWRHGRPWAWLAYWLVTVLNIYTFILSFLVMACQAVSALLLDRLPGHRRGLVSRVAGAQIAATIAAAPVLWMLFHSLGLATGTPRSNVLPELPYTFFVYAAGYSLGPTLTYLHSLPSVASLLTVYPIVLPVGILFAVLIILGAAQVAKKPFAAAIVIPWLFGPVLLVVLVSLASHLTYQARYSLAALPAFGLLIAIGACAPRGTGLRIAILGCAVVCLLSSLANYYWNSNYSKEDVRAALTQVKAADESGRPVVVVGQVSLAAMYYGAGLDIFTVDHCDAASDGDDPLDRVALRSANGLWVIVGRDWGGEGPRCLQRLAESYAIVEHRTFPGVEVTLLARRSQMAQP